MLMYGFYYYWRYRENQTSLVLYILAAVLYSTYACIWVRAAVLFTSGSNQNITQDYLTDWSVLRIHAKHPLLRDEVLCADYLYVSEFLKGST